MMGLPTLRLIFGWKKFCSYKVLGIKKKRLIVFAHEQPFQRYHEIKKLEAILRRLPPDVKFDY